MTQVRKENQERRPWAALAGRGARRHEGMPMERATSRSSKRNRKTDRYTAFSNPRHAPLFSKKSGYYDIETWFETEVTG